MKKTTRHIMELQAKLSHDLLKNDILLRLIDLNKTALLRSKETPGARANNLTDYLLSKITCDENILKAARTWHDHKVSHLVEEFIAAVRNWDDYRPRKEFERASGELRGHLERIATVFSGIREKAISEKAGRDYFQSFIESLLTVYDFVRALDERAPNFDCYMKPA